MIFLKLIFGPVISALRGLLAFLRTLKPTTLIIAALVLAMALGWYVWGQQVEKLARERDIAARGWQAEIEAHDQTVTNYKLAAAEFERKQVENLERTRERYEKNAQIALAAKSAAAADWRARFDRLRASKAASRIGGPGGIEMPHVPETAPGTPPSDSGPGRDTVAVKIDDLETLVRGSLQGEAIRVLWLSNEGVE